MLDQPCAKKAYSSTMLGCLEQGYLGQGMCYYNRMSTRYHIHCFYWSLSSLPLMF